MSDAYETTIGLEIHAELKTRTKMFCSSKNDPDEKRPNVNICPICLAHPGTLPVVNKEAVKHVLLVGTALGAQVADYTEFDRKNYFYPDLPKGYQISQFAYPLVSGGALKGVEITRVHLEEDTASSIHDDKTGTTLIDYNRSGVPLMELVTEPVMHSAEDAGAFARELQLLLRTLGVSEANMEKGQMRVEANVSVARKGERSVAYVEIKNLNSFNAMERAVSYEVKRQQGMLNRGEKLSKQTLGWDESKQATFPQRSKEGSADYRYFPDPDIPSLKLSEIPEYELKNLMADIPELPSERRERYLSLGINREDAEMYLRDTKLRNFFESVASSYSDPKIVKLTSNYIANDLVKIIRDSDRRDTDLNDENSADIPISVVNFKTIIDMVSHNKISSRSAKDLLLIASSDSRDPGIIAQERGMFQTISDIDLERVVANVINANPTVVLDYKAGKNAALEYLVGQSMKILKGAGDPKALRSLLTDRMG